MSGEKYDAHVARNAAARERLVAFVAELDLAAYARSVGHGWTVKVTAAPAIAPAPAAVVAPPRASPSESAPAPRTFAGEPVPLMR